MIHLMNLSQRYRGSTGVRAHRQEEPPVGQSGTPCGPGGMVRTIMGSHVQNESNHKLPQEFWWIKGGPAILTGGTTPRQSDGEESSNWKRKARFCKPKARFGNSEARFGNQKLDLETRKACLGD